MNKNSDKLGFELSKNKRNKSKKIKNSSEKSLIFSKKIIAMLEDKANQHNGENSKKVKILDLKRAYKSGFNSSKDLNKETIAHLNMYLRLMKGETNKMFNNFKSNEFEIIGNQVSVKGNISPDEEDYKSAEQDILKYELQGFDFNSAEELYLEDEEDKATTFYFE